MVLNDEKICIQIAKKPGARAVDLADVLNCELIEMSNALKSLVEVGDVKRVAGTAPNGQPAQLYSLSETFLASKEGRKIVAQLEAQAVAPAPAPAPVPVSAPAPAPAPVPAPPPAMPHPSEASTPAPAAPQAGMSKVQIAIAYITEHGNVLDTELRQAMNLRIHQAPSAWLGAALKSGRLRKDGKNWTLGSPAGAQAIVQSSPVPATNTPAGAAAVVAADATAAPLFDSATAAVTVDLAAQTTPHPRYRVGVWSDGVLELRRDGAIIAELTPAEQAIVSRHYHQHQIAPQAQP